jgi:hypothetical protein
MSWNDVPAKLAQYRTIEYGGDAVADQFRNNYGILSDADLDMLPVYKRVEFEAELDYRIGACENLSGSKAWRPETLRQV